MSESRRTVLTIGHSNHEQAAFVELLGRCGVTAVADVRSQPTSRLPQFDRRALAESLPDAGIAYFFLGRELGARRSERACYVGERADYERIAKLPAFEEGVTQLERLAEANTIALLCAEKEPLDCHRTVLVCRALRGRGLMLGHILADGTIEPHEETERRLMKLTKVQRTLFEPDLTREELLERAYEERGREIAYRNDPEEGP